MTPFTFVKFGGSVITDKRGQEAPDMPVIRKLADEIRTARIAQPEHRLLLGHGSGSFGHFYAARYNVHRGLRRDADWMGFALTSAAALRLNRIVVDVLLAAGVAALSLQPSASLRSAAGRPTHWQTDTIKQALSLDLVPVIHGDVAFDSEQGSAIVATEHLFTYLILHTAIRPDRIILVGENAIYTSDPRNDPDAQPIPLITRANIDTVLSGTGGSHAIDVTGGMRSKLELMWQLVQELPGLEVHLIGPQPGLLARALQGAASGEGTLIRAE